MQYSDGFRQHSQLDARMNSNPNYRAQLDTDKKDIYSPAVTPFVPPSTPAPQQRFRRNSTGSQDQPVVRNGGLNTYNTSSSSNAATTNGDSVYDSFRRTLVNKEDLYARQDNSNGGLATSTSGGFRKEQYTNRLYDRLRNNAIGDRRHRMEVDEEEDETRGITTSHLSNRGAIGSGSGTANSVRTRGSSAPSARPSSADLSMSPRGGDLNTRPTSFRRYPQYQGALDRGDSTQPQHSGRQMGGSGGNAAAVATTNAGLTPTQSLRLQDYMQASPLNHRLAQLKVVELVQYWMTTVGTRTRIDAAIRDTLFEVGVGSEPPVVVRQAWGSVMSPLKNQTPSTTAISSNTSINVKDKDNRGEDSAVVATPNSPQTTMKPVSTVGNKAVTYSKGTFDEPEVLPAILSPLRSQQQGSGVVVPSTSTDGSALLAYDPHRPTESPKRAGGTSTSPQQQQQQQQKETGATTSGSGDGDQVRQLRSTTPPPITVEDTQKGGGSQPFRRPHSQSTSEAGTAASSPTAAGSSGDSVSATGGGNAGGAGGGVIGSVPITSSLASDKDVAESSELASAKAHNGDPLQSRRPQLEQIATQPVENSNDTASANVIDAPAAITRTMAASVGASPRRHASYEAIPRFYFPLGKPTTKEVIVTDAFSAKLDNPHLKIAEGMAVLGGMYDNDEGGGLTGPVDSDDANAVPLRRRTAPLSTLRCIDDRNVHQYIQKEFGRLPAPPKPQQKVRLLSGRLRGNHSAASTAKQEAHYNNCLLQSMQRICAQCFGVPRYFGLLIVRLIQQQQQQQQDAANSSAPSSRSGGRNVSSLSLSSAVAGGGNAASSAGGGPHPHGLAQITAQSVKEFYDLYMRGKDSVRRTFDLLILSSRLPPTTDSVVREKLASTLSQEGILGQAGAAVAASSLRTYLQPADFAAYIETLLAFHPGLAFLRQTPDFQSKYLDTVVYRIFYEVDRFDRGCISYAEFAKSRLMDAFRQVDASEEINSVLLFFSYEHFYVIYCRFWELDEDRDMLLSQSDLMHYAPEDIMNPLIVQRVFASAGRRVRCPVKDRIGYEDFVWFCLSEEDKSTPTAIRYWFRILDLDGDGILSVYELRMFYDATKAKVAQYVIDSAANFEDVICQVFDMMRCSEYHGLPLSDILKEPEAAYVALNMLTNVMKFLQFEQRDPFVAHHERLLGGLEQSPWDRFARIEYDRMAQEADE